MTQPLTAAIDTGYRPTRAETSSKFAPPDQETVELCEHVLKRYHGELIPAGVTWQIIMCYGPRDKDDRLKGPALKHQGYPAAAMIKRNGLKERAKGLPCVTLLIDADQWQDWSREEKIALLDHEWEHISLDGDEDKDGMPKISLRLHDVQLGIFTKIIERHKENSLDLQEAKKGFERVRQVYAQGELW